MNDQPVKDSRMPRVLVVENELSMREANEEKLRYWHFEPVVATGRGKALLKDAVEKARKYRCQLALVDMHLLDDGDHLDMSGLRLVPELRPTRAVIYSGSISYQPVRDALSTYGALTYVGKAEDPESLRAVLDKHAAEICSCRRKLKITWPENLTSAQVAAIFSRDEPMPEDEPDDLIALLFPRAAQVTMNFLAGAHPTSSMSPRPRSLVMMARVDGGQPVIVKVSRADKIEKELANYGVYIENHLVGSYRPNLIKGETLWDMGGAVYNFVGSSENIIPLLQYYPTAKSRSIRRILKQFFVETWKPMYERPTRRTGQTLFEAYCAIWYGTWWLERLVKARENGLLPRIHSLYPSGADLNLPDPVEWLLERAENGQAGALDAVPLAVTHGDLHSENLLVDVRNLNAWVIDFERTGEGHVLQDFVELEADLISRLTDFTSQPEQIYALCLFTAGVGRLGRMALPEMVDPRLEKVLDTIVFLRKTAAEMTGLADPQQYLWGLLFNLVFRVWILLNANGPAEKVHEALLHAAILAHRLDHWGEAWPPAGWPPAVYSPLEPDQTNVNEKYVHAEEEHKEPHA